MTVFGFDTWMCRTQRIFEIAFCQLSNMASILKQALDEFVDPEGNLHMIFDLYKDTDDF